MKLWLFFLPIFSFSLFAEEPEEVKKHPIEIALDKKLEKTVSTAGMVEAFSKAREQWEAELEKNYKKLLTDLDPEGKEALKEAQEAWTKQQEKEIEFLIAFYSKMKGTMYRTIYAETTMTMVKQRALDLADMVEILGRRKTE